MRRIIATTVGALALLAVGAGSAVGASTADIEFSLNPATCQLTITSTKDISNFTVNGVKTENVNTTSITIQVAEGDVITVKSGTTTETFTVAIGACTHDPGDPHDPHDGHTGGDHDGDGDHDADDHH